MKNYHTVSNKQLIMKQKNFFWITCRFHSRVAILVDKLYRDFNPFCTWKRGMWVKLLHFQIKLMGTWPGAENLYRTEEKRENKAWLDILWSSYLPQACYVQKEPGGFCVMSPCISLNQLCFLNFLCSDIHYSTSSSKRYINKVCCCPCFLIYYLLYKPKQFVFIFPFTQYIPVITRYRNLEKTESACTYLISRHFEVHRKTMGNIHLS